jgi:hypothetical protein
MKEKAPRETQASRKPAALQPAAQGNAPPTADGLQHSAALAAQRRQMARMLGEGKAPAQRVKAKPTDEELKKLMAGHVSSTKGSCCNGTIAAAVELRKLADEGDVRAVLLKWIENEGTEDVDAGNHTACLVTWNEGTYIVDTTGSQFGGEAIFVGGLQNWIETIIGLQTQKVTHVDHDFLDAPISNSAMGVRTANWAYDALHPPKKEPMVEEGKHEGKGNDGKDKKEKESSAKKSKCYLTSACVEHLGLPDDCRELMVLREFRDGWLHAAPGGPRMIEAYYRTAPALVRAIETSPAPGLFYSRIYRVVRGCVDSIERGQPQRAMDSYVALVRALRAAFEIEEQGGPHDR